MPYPYDYDSENVKDNEQRKFQPDTLGHTAVNIKSNNLEAKLDRIIQLLELSVGGEELFDQNNIQLQNQFNETLTGAP